MVCCGQSPSRTSSPDRPIVLGDNNEGPVRQVRATIHYGGLVPGQISWVTGSFVDELLELKVLVDT